MCKKKGGESYQSWKCQKLTLLELGGQLLPSSFFFSSRHSAPLTPTSFEAKRRKLSLFFFIKNRDMVADLSYYQENKDHLLSSFARYSCIMYLKNVLCSWNPSKKNSPFYLSISYSPLKSFIYVTRYFWTRLRKELLDHRHRFYITYSKQSNNNFFQTDFSPQLFDSTRENPPPPTRASFFLSEFQTAWCGHRRCGGSRGRGSGREKCRRGNNTVENLPT